MCWESSSRNSWETEIGSDAGTLLLGMSADGSPLVLLLFRWRINWPGLAVFYPADDSRSVLARGSGPPENDAKMAQEVLNETLDLPKHIRYAHLQERFLKEAQAVFLHFVK